LASWRRGRASGRRKWRWSPLEKASGRKRRDGRASWECCRLLFYFEKQWKNEGKVK
jgi:hypothetical protein